MRQKFKNIILAAAAIFIITPVFATPAIAINCATHSSAAACQIQGGVTAAGGTADTKTAGNNIDSTLSKVINIFSFVIGVIAIFVLIIGGLSYMTSGGNEQKVSSAKSTILYAIVGLIIVMFAQIIVRFVIHKTKPS